MEEKIFGSCPYCGQVCETGIEFDNVERANAYAARHCRCDGAIRARAIEERKMDARDSIDELFGESCAEAHDFEPVESEVLDLLKTVADALIDDRIIGVSLDSVSFGKCKMKLGKDGYAVITRSETKSCQI